MGGFKIGDRVRVTEGFYKGFEGHVKGVSDEGNIIVVGKPPLFTFYTESFSKEELVKISDSEAKDNVSKAGEITSPTYYEGDVEPLDLMKAQMSPEAYKGFLRGNIIKYASRFGKKDSEVSEAKKIVEYAKYLACFAEFESKQKEGVHHDC